MADSEQTSSVSGPLATNAPAQNVQAFSENILFPVTTHKLTGHNYLQWSQFIMMFNSGHGCEDYLNGSAIQPSFKDPKFRLWRAENNLVMSWLICSMTTEIGGNFLLYSTAKEIWDAARDTFSSKENTAELFQIESMLHDLRQGKSSVTTSYTTLSCYWQQLDLSPMSGSVLMTIISFVRL